MYNRISIFEIIIEIIEVSIEKILKMKIEKWKKIVLIASVISLFVLTLFLSYKYLLPVFCRVFRKNIIEAECSGCNSKTNSQEKNHEQDLSKDEINKIVDRETQHLKKEIEKIREDNKSRLARLEKKVENMQNDQEYKYEYGTKEKLVNREIANEEFKKEEDNPFSHNNLGEDFDSTNNMIKAGNNARQWKKEGEEVIYKDTKTAAKIAVKKNITW